MHVYNRTAAILSPPFIEAVEGRRNVRNHVLSSNLLAVGVRTIHPPLLLLFQIGRNANLKRGEKGQSQNNVDDDDKASS